MTLARSSANFLPWKPFYCRRLPSLGASDSLASHGLFGTWRSSDMLMQRRLTAPIFFAVEFSVSLGQPSELTDQFVGREDDMALLGGYLLEVIRKNVLFIFGIDDIFKRKKKESQKSSILHYIWDYLGIEYTRLY